MPLVVVIVLQRFGRIFCSLVPASEVSVVAAHLRAFRFADRLIPRIVCRQDHDTEHPNHWDRDPVLEVARCRDFLFVGRFHPQRSCRRLHSICQLSQSRKVVISWSNNCSSCSCWNWAVGKNEFPRSSSGQASLKETGIIAKHWRRQSFGWRWKSDYCKRVGCRDCQSLC